MKVAIDRSLDAKGSHRRNVKLGIGGIREVEFLVENRTLARRLHEVGIETIVGDPRRTDTYLKADLDRGLRA